MNEREVERKGHIMAGGERLSQMCVGRGTHTREGKGERREGSHCSSQEANGTKRVC